MLRTSCVGLVLFCTLLAGVFFSPVALAAPASPCIADGSIQVLEHVSVLEVLNNSDSPNLECPFAQGMQPNGIVQQNSWTLPMYALKDISVQ